MQVKKVDVMDIRPYRECSRFEVCSCNKCPLDPDIAMRVSVPDDEKCKATRTTRQNIALKYPELLPLQGLTAKEAANRKMSIAMKGAEVVG
jgi:hypothetical protein